MQDVFFQDPWWLILIKVVALFVILLLWTIFNVWYERRLVGKMQHRLGPIMNGPLGLGQALGDGAKLIFKEDFRPKNADKWIFNLAPILTGVAAFTCWTVIPFGGEVRMFGVETRLQVTDLPECESELVSGYLTEYSGFRYALYFLAEYINMATVSAVCTTLFLGGYLAPWPLNLIPFLNNPWLGPVWFMIKVQLLISVFWFSRPNHSTRTATSTTAIASV